MKKKKSARPRWTKAEIADLRKLYRTHSNAYIATLLGRNVSSILFKACRMGLSKSPARLKQMGRDNIASRWTRKGRKAAAKKGENGKAKR